jgi:hypothetical protein
MIAKRKAKINTAMLLRRASIGIFAIYIVQSICWVGSASLPDTKEATPHLIWLTCIYQIAEVAGITLLLVTYQGGVRSMIRTETSRSGHSGSSRTGQSSTDRRSSTGHRRGSQESRRRQSEYRGRHHSGHRSSIRAHNSRDRHNHSRGISSVRSHSNSPAPDHRNHSPAPDHRNHMVKTPPKTPPNEVTDGERPVREGRKKRSVDHTIGKVLNSIRANAPDRDRFNVRSGSRYSSRRRQSSVAMQELKELGLGFNSNRNSISFTNQLASQVPRGSLGYNDSILGSDRSSTSSQPASRRVSIIPIQEHRRGRPSRSSMSGGGTHPNRSSITYSSSAGHGHRSSVGSVTYSGSQPSRSGGRDSIIGDMSSIRESGENLIASGGSTDAKPIVSISIESSDDKDIKDKKKHHRTATFDI